VIAPRRVRAPEVLAGASGLAVLAALAVAPGSRADGLLAMLALPAAALPVLQATRRSPAVPMAAATLAGAGGLVSMPVLGIRLLRGRTAGGPGIAAAAGAAGMLAGGLWSTHAEGVPGAVAPHVPARPAPPEA
jgi:hypothetical protein